jgi:O-antigen/teichoic acid export membrane protein
MVQLWRSIGFTSGARVYGVVAGAITLILTARILGAEGRGIVAGAVTWTLLFATVGYLSLGQVALHRATGKHHGEWLGTTLAALLAMTAAVSVAGWIIAGVLYAATSGEAFGDLPVYAFALGFASLPFLVWEQYGTALLTALDRLSFYNRAEVVGRTTGVVGVLILVGALGAGVVGALVALFLAQLVVAAAGWRYLIRLAGPSLALDRSTVRELVGGGLKLHLNAIGTFMFTSAAVLIVQLLRGPTETGQFQLVVSLLVMAMLIPQAASLVLYGEVTRLGPDAAWPANRRVLITLSGLMMVISAVGFVLSPELIPLVFGEDFAPAVAVFQILSFALIGQTVSMVMAPQWIGRGLFWQASAITVILGVCNVVACLLLVESEGMEGAAYALLGVYTFAIVGNGAMALWVERRVRRIAPTRDSP